MFVMRGPASHFLDDYVCYERSTADTSAGTVDEDRDEVKIRSYCLVQEVDLPWKEMAEDMIMKEVEFGIQI